MSLHNKNSDLIIKRAISELDGVELKVFLSIFSNRRDFATSASFIATQINANVRSVKKAIKSLTKRNWLYLASKRRINGKFINIYDLTSEFVNSMAENANVKAGDGNFTPEQAQALYQECFPEQHLSP
jgi:hypothetical protein